MIMKNSVVRKLGDAKESRIVTGEDYSSVLFCPFHYVPQHVT